MALGFARMETPLGTILIFASNGSLCGLGFADRCDGLKRDLNRRFGGQPIEDEVDPAGAVTRLTSYFAGELDALEGIPADPGGTAFQRDVWTSLRRVPAGRTVSYSELGRRSGHPGAIRAVGLANARNPVALVIPCHRVIGADGSLTGYGGGLERKAWLLRHERVLL